jgi:hypothetical protein
LQRIRAELTQAMPSLSLAQPSLRIGLHLGDKRRRIPGMGGFHRARD